MKTITVNGIKITIVRKLFPRLDTRRRKNGNLQVNTISMLEILCISCQQPKTVSWYNLKNGRCLRCISCGQGITRYTNRTELTEEQIRTIIVTNYTVLLCGSVNKRNSKNNKHKLLLNPAQIAELIFNKCNYCGAAPNKKCRNYNILYNGIDRIDSAGNYEETNTVTCCKICNFAKNVLSLNEFYDWLDKIAKFNGYVKPEMLKEVA